MIVTKSVLLFGVVVFAALLFIHSPVFDIIYVMPSAPPKQGLFNGLWPVVWSWIALLTIALVLDYVGIRRSRNDVRPFASALNAGEASEGDAVTQASDGNLRTTSTSGSVGDRLATVTLREVAGSRTGPIFRVDVACKCPWVLEIRRNTLEGRLLGMAGAVVATGYPDLDAAVVVQADDAEGVRQWLGQPAVRNGLISLFQRHKVESLSLCDGGSVLRAELVTRNPLAQPRQDAPEVVETLSMLAKTLERG